MPNCLKKLPIKNRISKNVYAAIRKAGYLTYYVHHTGYVMTYKVPKIKNESLHRVIWRICRGPIPSGMQIDHINGIRTDNRLTNLRLATKNQNSFNCKPPRGRPYKGVHYKKKNRNWVAYIGKKPRNNIGSFSTLKLALLAYNKAAKLRYGKFARLNQIPK